MAQPTAADLTEMSARADAPFFVPPVGYKFGGVDPLGLRQINFDMMDQVLPGLNNVARHIRPFVVVTWAWHRAIQIAKALEVKEVKREDILDFVDRIDVIYVWSQFLRNPNADLPGRQVLEQMVKSSHWVFGGEKWHAQRKTRQYSTALMAPINYGPALKSMRWIESHQNRLGIFIPSLAAEPAIAAFEAQIVEHLSIPAFSRFGEVEVSAADVRACAEAWALDSPSEPERKVMASMLLGDGAPPARKNGCALMLAAASDLADASLDRIRATMAGAPSNFVPSHGLKTTQQAWRKVQVRQLFRLVLESLFYWATFALRGAPKTTNNLVSIFISQYFDESTSNAEIDWMSRNVVADSGPTELQERLVKALDDPSRGDLPVAIVDGLRFCLSEVPKHSSGFERADRLPLTRAKRDAEAWSTESTKDFLRNVFEHWIFAQHVYWSVGRGLADARARGKTILRLKIVLEENGWALAPGVANASRPSPTADRLQTAWSLAEECELCN